MSASSLAFQINELPAQDGNLVLELQVEGKSIATARAALDVLDNMHTVLGMDREAVAASLRDTLRDHLKHQLERVRLSPPVEIPGEQLIFASRYTYQEDSDHIGTGIVWYDVKKSHTWPESVVPVVRNKMRFEVHRKLTETAAITREIVDLNK